ncbi:RNA polymerase II transcriptional coactivator-like protein [Podospora appendiculata]|uniref:RNA polymerase II transcriptional coactivator-like protein n=1 Tax=Podospora appendiculata TaxID=314037 RepID=A0AAE0X4Y7_9PEZI|nr:RNA polymerase II transcriptional coactivator-like protein [Podospora appendiculata]
MPPRKRQLEQESDGESYQVKKSRSDKPKSKKELGKGSDADGNMYWEIGPMRRVNTASFKGKTLINIREYYTAPDGESKPGKKGISLSLEQYQQLLKIIPDLNKDLRSQGHEVDDPDVGAEPADLSVKPASVKKEKKSKKAKKSNIEETSDEDEDGMEEDD